MLTISFLQYKSIIKIFWRKFLKVCALPTHSSHVVCTMPLFVLLIFNVLVSLVAVSLFNS